LLTALKARFDANKARHPGLGWAKVQAQLKRENLAASALPVFARFDPPWTPAFLHHTEVLIRMEIQK